MPSTSTLSLPSQTASSPGRTAAGWAAAGLAAVLGALAAAEVLDPPSTVDLVVVNETDRDVTVVVAGQAGAPVLPVATVDAGEERRVDQVVDQGRTWIVTFRVDGEPAEELEVPRADLAEDGFRIVVPAAVAEAAPPEAPSPEVAEPAEPAEDAQG